METRLPSQSSSVDSSLAGYAPKKGLLSLPVLHRTMQFRIQYGGETCLFVDCRERSRGNPNHLHQIGFEPEAHFGLLSVPLGPPLLVFANSGVKSFVFEKRATPKVSRSAIVVFHMRSVTDGCERPLCAGLEQRGTCRKPCTLKFFLNNPPTWSRNAIAVETESHSALAGPL